MSLNLTRTHRAISIAVASDAVVVVVGRGSAARTYRVPAELRGTGDDAAALNDAFAQVGRELGLASDTRGRIAVNIAILPPLVDARLIPLPPLRPADTHAVLRRDSGRYFVGVQAPHIIAVHSTAAMPHARTGGPVLAAAANVAFIDAVSAAASAAGWQVHGIVPAHAAWTIAAAGAAGAGAGAQAYVAVTGDTAHIVKLSGRRAASIRRIPLSARADIIAAAEGSPSVPGSGGEHAGARARVAIYAAGGVRQDIARSFSSAGWSVASGGSGRGGDVPDGDADDDNDAAAIAAQFAGDARVRFVSSAFAADRRALEKRVALRLFLAAAVLVVMAGAIEMWGAQREWNTIRERRAEIRGQVGPLLATRDSIDVLLRQASEIDTMARGTPRWTPALFDLALLLPPESHLTGLYASGDTLIIEAQGAGAGTALQALRSAASLRDARLVGAVDREMDGGATSVERFRLSARLAPPPAAPTVARSEEEEEQ